MRLVFDELAWDIQGIQAWGRKDLLELFCVTDVDRPPVTFTPITDQGRILWGANTLITWGDAYTEHYLEGHLMASMVLPPKATIAKCHYGHFESEDYAAIWEHYTTQHPDVTPFVGRNGAFGPQGQCAGGPF